MNLLIHGISPNLKCVEPLEPLGPLGLEAYELLEVKTTPLKTHWREAHAVAVMAVMAVTCHSVAVAGAFGTRFGGAWSLTSA